MAEIQFHVFPSRVFAKLSDYLKFLIGCSNRSRVTSRLVIIDSVANLYDCDMASRYTYLHVDKCDYFIAVVES